MPGNTVPFDALLEVFPELVGKHLACGVTDAGVIPPVIGDRDAAPLNENGKNVLPIDLVGLNDRVDAEPGGYAVCKDFDCVVPEIDAGDGVIPVSDTKNDRAAGGVGERGEEFVEIAAHFLLKVDPPPFIAGKKSREVIHETPPHTMPDRRDLCSCDPGFARETQCP